jgi:homoserine kinase
MIRVRVPATSANIAVGYDCMGLALSEIAQVDFEQIPSGLVIEGCEAAYCNEDNLIYQAFCKALDYMNESITGLKMVVDTNVPYARGMGSSATCIVAGIAGASAMFNNKMTLDEIFQLATEMEGHPDNIAPAVFGSLCVSIMDEGKAYVTQFKVHEDLKLVTLIPDFEVSTKEARKVLPTTMSYADAVYQMGRCVALSTALQNGDEEMIRRACKDRMQQPYRAKLIPQFDHIKDLCEKYGMITMFISGSGSTMIALCKQQENAEALMEEVKQTYSTWDVRLLKCINEGVQVDIWENTIL